MRGEPPRPGEVIEKESVRHEPIVVPVVVTVFEATAVAVT